MGLAASQGRLLMLIARKSDIELQVQTINTKRMRLAMANGNLSASYAATVMARTTSTAAAATTDDAQDATYSAEQSAIQSQDKVLEMQEADLNTQHKAIETEYDAVKKVIEKNIEISFKTLG